MRKEQMTDPSQRALRRPSLRLILAVAAVFAALCAAAAYGDEVVVGNLVLRVVGMVNPDTLPKHSFAPVELQGKLDISTKDASVPPALHSAVVEFDRDGHLETRGLPVCPPARIEQTTPEVARSRCRGAIVATGTVTAVIAYPGDPAYSGSSPLTVFNGPPTGGEPTVIFHAQVPTYPVPTTDVVVVPIERIAHGPYAYRLSGEIPPIAEGHGSLIAGTITIHRLYKQGGRTLSYTSARCAKGFLEAHGSLTFIGGAVIAGSIFYPCTARG
jgi:hypothetical protein